MTLWQNIRHPYLSMLARGEFEQMPVLFDLYMSFADINRAAAKAYYGAEGQYNTEITTSLGTINPNIYGPVRGDMPKGYAKNRWGGAVDISPGLELICLMLDYCDYTGNHEYLHSTVIPYAKDLLTYIASRFSRRLDGKIDLYPLHFVETYWDTRNPVTVTAGMLSVIDRILETDASDRVFFEQMRALTPDLPYKYVGGETVLDAAAEYDPTRHNVEPGELYPVFPYRYFGEGKIPSDVMHSTYEYTKSFGSFRPYVIGAQPGEPSYSGWQYTGACAALLRKTDDLREILESNAALHNKAYRFPAAWGPCYDSVPDVDHGANILTALQLALLQCEDGKIHICPAIPDGWNARFKLFAPQNTIVECEYRNGKVVSLIVTPAEQEYNVVINQPNLCISADT